MVFIVGFLLWTQPIHVPESWLTATCRLESNGRRWAIGDRGRSRGLYQIQAATWRRYGGRRPWSYWAHDPAESRRVARQILTDCVRACQRARQPLTFKRVRWYYRHGGF